MANQEKITVYNLADLKNTSDDAIPNYLNSLKFTQSHRLTDVRLALGYSAFLVAAACFLWDYKLGFDSTKYLTAGAVAFYTLLNGALTFWILYVEKGTIYEGTSPSGQEKIKISTKTKKNVPTYYVAVEVENLKTKGKTTHKIEKSFTEWFDAAGRFVAAPFQTVLASQVPAIGKLDVKRANPAPEAGQQQQQQQQPAYTPEILDMLANANVSVVGTEATGASGADAKKGGKRRKV